MKITDYDRTLNMLRKDPWLHIKCGIAGGGLGECKDITVYFDKAKKDKYVYFVFSEKGKFIHIQQMS